MGVIKDLATHDIDVVGWLSDSRIAQVSAQTQHLSGQEHEDLVLVTGALESGPSFSLVVDRISPTKVRRTRVLGERGVLEADTLTGDLFFYENAEVDVAWSTDQQFRGVSEGNVTRYALRRDEPLRVELETFIDLVQGDDGADVVRLERGVEIVQIAETVIESARSGRTLAVGSRRLMRAVVVALGKIGLPIAAADRPRGPRRGRLRHRRARGRSGQRGPGAVSR